MRAILPSVRLWVPAQSTAPARKAFCVEPRCGRLIVTRLETLHTPLEVGQVQFAMARALEKVKHKAVICSDWRAIDIFSPAVADSILDMLNVTNHKVLRGAILLNTDRATFNLQVERVLRDAGNPSRKCFCDKPKLIEWLAETLNASENEEVERFLS